MERNTDKRKRKNRKIKKNVVMKINRKIRVIDIRQKSRKNDKDTNKDGKMNKKVDRKVDGQLVTNILNILLGTYKLSNKIQKNKVISNLTL